MTRCRNVNVDMLWRTNRQGPQLGYCLESCDAFQVERCVIPRFLASRTIVLHGVPFKCNSSCPRTGPQCENCYKVNIATPTVLRCKRRPQRSCGFWKDPPKKKAHMPHSISGGSTRRKLPDEDAHHDGSLVWCNTARRPFGNSAPTTRVFF